MHSAQLHPLLVVEEVCTSFSDLCTSRAGEVKVELSVGGMTGTRSFSSSLTACMHDGHIQSMGVNTAPEGVMGRQVSTCTSNEGLSMDSRLQEQ